MPLAKLIIGSGSSACFNCVPGISSFWISTALVALMPLVAKKLSPQLIT